MTANTQAKPSPKALKPLDVALDELLVHAQPLGETDWVSTFAADRRVLAQNLISELQVPPQDNSSMDGYAVRCADLAVGHPLPVTQRIPAGTSGVPLAMRSVARIFTGAPIPQGADAVVMQEACEVMADGRVLVKEAVEPGQWIRRSGEDVRRGEAVLLRGERLNPASLGLAAGIGVADLPVVRQPRVALFSTGDELVMPGAIAPASMAPGAIYNSNRFFLRALLERIGCMVSDMGIVPDQRLATVQALRQASQAHDLILTSGGVSVGEEDHIKPAVQELGHLDLWQIGMKPGKPFAYGRVGSAHFVGLPGNPVSSYVTFLLLVRPFLLKLQGATAWQWPAQQRRAGFDWPRGDKRREFLRVREGTDGDLALFANQSSGVLSSVVWGDGLVDNPAGQTISKGDLVRYLPFSAVLS